MRCGRPFHRQAVVDIATLTGACMVALGPGIAGVMTPSEAMADIISGASKTAGALPDRSQHAACALEPLY